MYNSQVTENEFATVKLPLEDFKPYYRGLPLAAETHPLDLSAITNIGIKVDNGPYLPDNQPGVSALEIDWIKAVKWLRVLYNYLYFEYSIFLIIYYIYVLFLKCHAWLDQFNRHTLYDDKSYIYIDNTY